MNAKEHRYRSPLSPDDVMSMNAGDRVYISGPAYEIKTVRQYVGIFERYKRGETLPFNLAHATIYHTFSSVEKTEKTWKVNYLGFFSSFVLNRQMPDFIRAFKIRAIIGKGGMSNEVLESMKECKCVYLAGVSGCAAYYSQFVEGITAVYFEEWGLDRVVMYDLRGLGPLLVTMDAHGKSMYTEVEKKKKAALRKIKTDLLSSQLEPS